MMYSPYVRPGCSLKGDKTVVVNARLHDVEALAYNFLVNFAKTTIFRSITSTPFDYGLDVPKHAPPRTRRWPTANGTGNENGDRKVAVAFYAAGPGIRQPCP